eukprot:CAMPEP_0172502046 /NCGR_PEP_ID=MMETSP1066-20121228/155903_1 /TAXON_ID=671091 /ORGANISM="Coscinodiscus wailesii, Strain CCMP2513" /LENGTH=380 /DNA_ID=CAMNT_0013277149 /DNA_START=163 /DNA_END=1306 /DNA_ORIENTATION=-
MKEGPPTCVFSITSLLVVYTVLMNEEGAGYADAFSYSKSHDVSKHHVGLSRCSRSVISLPTTLSEAIETDSVLDFVDGCVRRNDGERRKRRIKPSLLNRLKKSKRQRNMPSLPPTPHPSSLSSWACTTDVSTLRLMFGTNRNKFWGDLDNISARRLYHALLPCTLIALHSQTTGLTAHELAPLAFEARRAAKQYVRERCNVPGRVFAMAFDGFRHLKKYGFWSSKGLSWEQIWCKYEREIQQELRDVLGDEATKNKDLTSQVCMRILERSCVTNTAIDDLCTHQYHQNCATKHQTLLTIASNYQSDVNTILNNVTNNTNTPTLFTSTQLLHLKLLLSTRRKILILQQSNNNEAGGPDIDNASTDSDNGDLDRGGDSVTHC